MWSALYRLYQSWFIGCGIFVISDIVYTSATAMVRSHWYHIAFGNVGGVVLFISILTLIGWLLLKWLDK